MITNRRRSSATLTKIISSITDEDKRRTRDRMLIAVKIAEALEAKNLSQKAFAKLMGKNESEISEWLSGNRNFTVDTLSDIGNCLGIHLLPTSDMRTKRISTAATYRKVNKKRSPSPYIMSGCNIFTSFTGKWNTSNDNILVIA